MPESIATASPTPTLDVPPPSALAPEGHQLLQRALRAASRLSTPAQFEPERDLANGRDLVMQENLHGPVGDSGKISPTDDHGRTYARLRARAKGARGRARASDSGDDCQAVRGDAKLRSATRSGGAIAPAWMAACWEGTLATVRRPGGWQSLGEGSNSARLTSALVGSIIASTIEMAPAGARNTPEAVTPKELSSMCAKSTVDVPVPPTQVAVLGHHQPPQRASRAAAPVGFSTTVTHPHPSHPRSLGFTRQVESRVRLTEDGELLLPWRKFGECLAVPSDRYAFDGIEGDVAYFKRVDRFSAHQSVWMRRTALIWLPAADVDRAVSRLEQKAVVA